MYFHKCLGRGESGHRRISLIQEQGDLLRWSSIKMDFQMMHFSTLLFGLLTFDGDAIVGSSSKSPLIKYATWESQSLPSEDGHDAQAAGTMLFVATFESRLDGNRRSDLQSLYSQLLWTRRMSSSPCPYTPPPAPDGQRSADNQELCGGGLLLSMNLPGVFLQPGWRESPSLECNGVWWCWWLRLISP